MGVRRVVANLAASDPAVVRSFYEDVIGLPTAMDMGWIVTFAAEQPSDARPQVSVCREGGSGTPVPALSIEVDDFDEVHARAIKAGCEIPYGPVDEPWGVRRFYVRDPIGTLINVLVHAE